MRIRQCPSHEPITCDLRLFAGLRDVQTHPHLSLSMLDT